MILSDINYGTTQADALRGGLAFIKGFLEKGNEPPRRLTKADVEFLVSVAAEALALDRARSSPVTCPKCGNEDADAIIVVSAWPLRSKCQKCGHTWNG